LEQLTEYQQSAVISLSDLQHYQSYPIDIVKVYSYY